MASVNLIVHYPTTNEGNLMLARRVADVHAAAVTQRIKALDCPSAQQLALVDAVIATAHNRNT